MNIRYDLQNACFYFTYTFMFELPFKLETLKQQCIRNFPQRLLECPPAVIIYPSKKRYGIEPFLSLRSPELRLSFVPIDTELHLRFYSKQNCAYQARVLQSVILTCKIRVLRSGVGTVTFKLSKKGNWLLTFDEAIAISRFATEGALEAEKGRLRIKGPMAWMKVLGQKSNRITLFKIFVNIVEKLQEFGVTWLEIDKKLVRKNDLFANPYVTMRLELSQGIEKFSTLFADENFVNELARVVLRVRQEWEQVNRTYIAKHVDGLCSYTPHDRYWLTVHMRSCTYLHCHESGDRKVYPTITYPEALIDTIELLRMRWHCYATYNTYLDEVMYLMMAPKKRIKPADDIALIKKIALIRNQISTVLESPLSFKRAAGSLNEIYERGIEVFGIDKLESLVLEKLRMLDRIYIARLEILRAADFEKTRVRRIGKKRQKNILL